MTIFLRRNVTFLFLLGVIALLPFASTKVIFFGIPLYLPEITLLLALISFWFTRPLRRPFFGDRLFSLGLALFLLGATLSFSLNPFSFTGLGMIKSWFFFPALFGFLLWQELENLERRRIALYTWLLSTLSVAFRSILFIVHNELTFDHRLAGDYSSPNFLAFFLAPSLPILLYFFFSRKKKEQSSSLWRPFFLMSSFFIACVTLFFTHSYGVWLGELGAFFVILLGEALRRPRRVLFYGGALLCMSIMGLVVLERENAKWHSLFDGDPRSSLASRSIIWRAAIKIASDHPFFGIGVGRFQSLYLEYQPFFPPYLEWSAPEPHSIFLAIFLATGGVGFLGFLLMIGRVGALLVSQITSQNEEKKRWFPLLMLSLLALFLISGVADTPYFKNDLAYALFLLIALSFPFSQQKEKSLF
jgi:O-antigen ligase